MAKINTCLNYYKLSSNLSTVYSRPPLISIFIEKLKIVKCPLVSGVLKLDFLAELDIPLLQITKCALPNLTLTN